VGPDTDNAAACDLAITSHVFKCGLCILIIIVVAGAEAVWGRTQTMPRRVT
jgi:hypothetical protein